MKSAKWGRSKHCGIHFLAAAMAGLSLSACGGGSTAPSAAAPTAAQGSSAVTSAAGGGSSSTSSGSTAAPGSASSGATGGTGVVTINWMPPTENTDGTPLENLAGYNIHYGTSSGTYTKTIWVSNPGIASFVVQSLSPGTYYFTVAAVNASGNESPLSAEVSAQVN